MKAGRSFDRRRLIEVLADAAGRREGTIHGAHHFGDDDLVGRSSQAKPARSAAARVDKTGDAEFSQDLFEKGRRDVETLENLVALAPFRIALGDCQKSETTVFRGGSEAHGGIVGFVDWESQQ